MYRILAIGNSFSEDAAYFLHPICERGGIENEVINLYIGGCSLERHWSNIEANRVAYQFQLNGVKTDRYVSIQEILDEKKIDVIVLHQASGDSGWENTYEPFLGLILGYLEKSTAAQIFLDQTWAYEKDSNHEHFMRYHRDQQEMFDALKKAYAASAKRYGLPLIKSGEVIQKLRQLDYFKSDHCITRDGYHLNYLYGRYAVALMWAKVLTSTNVMANDFVPQIDFMPFEKAEASIIEQIKHIVSETE